MVCQRTEEIGHDWTFITNGSSQGLPCFYSGSKIAFSPLQHHLLGDCLHPSANEWLTIQIDDKWNMIQSHISHSQHLHSTIIATNHYHIPFLVDKPQYSPRKPILIADVFPIKILHLIILGFATRPLMVTISRFPPLVQYSQVTMLRQFIEESNSIRHFNVRKIQYFVHFCLNALRSKFVVHIIFFISNLVLQIKQQAKL